MTSLKARADDFDKRAKKLDAQKDAAQKDALSARSKELADFALEASDILRRYRAGKLDEEV